jgi:hypothetical protein
MLFHYESLVGRRWGRTTGGRFWDRVQNRTWACGVAIQEPIPDNAGCGEAKDRSWRGDTQTQIRSIADATVPS